MLDKIRTVLVHNSHPGNIGSSARAMKNMGLSSLYLVAPKKFPSKEALYMASRADDVVEAAQVVDTVQTAIQACTLVFGASARTRAVKWIEITPKEASHLMIQHLKENDSHKIAVLYGCEQNGLSNEELELTQYQIVIPAVADYASLNVSQAVQLISYEIYQAYLENQKEDPSLSQNELIHLASHDDIERFYSHLEEILQKLNFLDKENPGLLMTKLRKLFARTKLEIYELNILRGIFTSMSKILH